MKYRLSEDLIFTLIAAFIAGILVPVLGVTNVVLAQDTQGREEFSLEEVTVTAQKREENLQIVGAAVSAIRAEKIEDTNVSNIEDLQGLVPGLQLGESFGFAQIMIRGIGTDNPFAGGDPSVAMHVDGAVIGQSSAQLGTMFDVNRIEVVRGPQGTLYGRNATGGSVNIITNKPTEELSGYARLTGGNYSLIQFDGAVSGPINDKLLARVATRIVNRGGYGTNLYNGDDIDDAETYSFRGHLKWLISEDADLLLTASYHKEDDRNYMPKYRSPSYPNSTNPILQPTPQGYPRASDPYDIYADAKLQNKRDHLSLTGELNWGLNEQFSLKSITNYQSFEKIPQQDFDATSAPYYIQSEQIKSDQFSEEFQINYDGDRLFGLLGLYFYDEEISSDNRLLQNIPVPPCGPPTNDLMGYNIDQLCFQFRGKADIRSYAIFSNINYDINNELILVVGARYTYEERSGVTDRWFVPGITPPGILPSGIALVPYNEDGDFNNFSPTIGLKWLATGDVMFYTTYSEGFKSGILPTGQRNPLTKQEKIKAYEAGMKGNFLEDRLRFNTAVFYYDYTDLQVGRSIPAGTTGFSLFYENADSAEVKGFEMEATWLPTSSLRLDSSLTYLDAEYTDYITQDPFDIVQELVGGDPAPDLQLAGNRFFQTPEWAFSISAEQYFNVSQNWAGIVGLELVYQDDVFFSQFNHPEIAQEGFTKLNGNIKFTTLDDKWTINIWGKNLTDKTAYNGMFIINGSRSNLGMLAPPRTFGVTLGYKF